MKKNYLDKYNGREIIERIVLAYQTFPFTYQDAKNVLPYLDPRALYYLIRDGYLKGEKLICPECGRPHAAATYTATKKALKLVMV